MAYTPKQLERMKRNLGITDDELVEEPIDEDFDEDAKILVDEFYKIADAYNLEPHINSESVDGDLTAVHYAIRFPEKLFPAKLCNNKLHIIIYFGSNEFDLTKNRNIQGFKRVKFKGISDNPANKDTLSWYGETGGYESLKRMVNALIAHERLDKTETKLYQKFKEILEN
jgi:hypothetical protein